MSSAEATSAKQRMVRPKIVVIGAGFGGLFLARHLAGEPVDVLIIDRHNYHTFTPLIYQVATAGLRVEDVSYSVRKIFGNKRNVNFMLAEVTGIDKEAKQVQVTSHGKQMDVPYDYLVIAAGTVTNYFGNEELAQRAFGLKTLEDAVLLKSHIIRLFEQTEWTESPEARNALTNIVVVGGGATGLEMAGALYELSNHVLRHEYKRLGGIQMRVILVEMLDTLLQPYPEKLRRAAKEQLEDIGVEVILGQSVERVEPGRVHLSDGTVIPSHTLVWTAGVKASPLAQTVGVALAKGGTLPVKPTLELKEAPDIYAIGDIAYLEGPDGKPYPQLIPVAQQQAALVARNLLHRVRDEMEELFVYRDKGIMATIGRRRAVAWPFKRFQLTGWIAWISWLGLHLVELLGFRNRVAVFINWVWNYLAYDPVSRMVLENGEHRATALIGANQERPGGENEAEDERTGEHEAHVDGAEPQTVGWREPQAS